MAALRKPKSRKQAVTSPPAASEANRSAEPMVRLGPEVCSDLAAASEREWLVTNGIGGFASGTVAGSATRRYHGLLMAALDPPARRTLLVGGIDEIVSSGERRCELSTHHWLSGAVAPRG